MLHLGQNIKLLREKRNLTQTELALKIRVGTKIIEKFESGEKTPDIPALMRISNVLEIPVSELCGQGIRASGFVIDRETEQLINGLGLQKTKLILKKVKELSDDEFKQMVLRLNEEKCEVD